MPRVKANGIEIEYESFGHDSDPAVLLIMGFSAQMIVWPDSLCRGLAALGYRVVRFDNRDVGLSTHLSELGTPNVGALMTAMATGEKISAPYALDDMAADAAALLDELGIARAHIVGASMGGMIAQLVAANHPEKTKSLISIMSTTGKRGLRAATPEAMAAITTPPASDSLEDRIAAGIKAWRTIGSPAYPAGDEELRDLAGRSAARGPYDPAGIARQMAAIFAAQPRNEKLAKLTCPALVLHGEADPLIPYDSAEDTAASIPGSELAIMPGVGHDVSNANVHLYLQHMGDFLNRAERKAKAA